MTVIFKPDADVSAVLKEIKESLGKGQVTAEEELPLKKLAYAVAGSFEARLYQLQLTAAPEKVGQLTQELKVRDGVVRFLMTSVPDKIPKEKAAQEAKA